MALGDAPPVRRRLLLISYHFPPGPGAGALRWQKMSTHAAERGWGLDVISLHPEDLSRQDRRRLEDLPAGTRVFGVHHRAPGFDRAGKRLWETLKSVRGAIPGLGRERAAATGSGSERSGAKRARPESLTPEEMTLSVFDRSDLRRAFHAWLAFVREGVWADDAAEVGLQLTAMDSYDAVISSGPPQMAHVAGRRVAERAGVPFVMDLRDPWSIPRRRPEPTASPVWFRIAERHEGRAVATADLVVANTDAVRRAMEDRYSDSGARFITVTNAADEPVAPRPSSTFVATYGGALYLDRDPRPLFRAARAVIERHGLSPSEFRVELVGRVESYEGVPTSTLARDEGIGDHVDVCPPVPHGELLERLARSAVLVSLPQDSPWAIPSKIFEYMQFRAWLLVYAYPGTPIWELLEGSDAHLVRPDDMESGIEALESCYRRFRDGMDPSRIAEDDERFSRRYQADRLFEALDRMVEDAGTTPGA